jgi:ubiquitin-activating enzyme E1 C
LKVLNDLDGIYTYTYEAERKENCLTCSQIIQEIEIKDPKYKLQDLIELLCTRPDIQMKSPGLTTYIDGKNKTLYMRAVQSIEEKTRENLSKTLIELGLTNNSMINVADITTPSVITLKLKFLVN